MYPDVILSALRVCVRVCVCVRGRDSKWGRSVCNRRGLDTESIHTNSLHTHRSVRISGAESGLISHTPPYTHTHTHTHKWELENIDDLHLGQLAYILAVSSDGDKQVDVSTVTENSFLTLWLYLLTDFCVIHTQHSPSWFCLIKIYTRVGECLSLYHASDPQLWGLCSTH